jgi:hypothetical protein
MYLYIYLFISFYIYLYFYIINNIYLYFCHHIYLHTRSSSPSRKLEADLFFQISGVESRALDTALRWFFMALTHGKITIFNGDPMGFNGGLMA